MEDGFLDTDRTQSSLTIVRTNTVLIQDRHMTEPVGEVFLDLLLFSLLGLICNCSGPRSLKHYNTSGP